jgi:apolipoprotein N-acyltransferase
VILRDMNSISNKYFGRASVILISIIIAGICWFLSTGLSGDLWWLAWFAPLPVLLIIPEVSARKAFWAAFISYLFGRLSWVTYLHSVLPVILVIIFTLALPLVFALILLATRKIVFLTNHWAAFLSFPVLYTGFEWIYFQFSRDGTAGSLGYSQSNCLHLIQIASVTGVTGVSFFICLVPALLAAALYFRKTGNNHRIPLRLLFVIAGGVFLFGFIRLRKEEIAPKIRLGMIVIDESSRQLNADSIFKQYAKYIDSMSRDSVKLILLPEKIASVKNNEELGILMESAKKYHVDILAGITREQENEKLNQAVLISYDRPVQVYTKVNLYEGEMYPLAWSYARTWTLIILSGTIKWFLLCWCLPGTLCGTTGCIQGWRF